MLMISLSAVKDGNLDKGESYLIFLWHNSVIIGVQCIAYSIKDTSGIGNWALESYCLVAALANHLRWFRYVKMPNGQLQIPKGSY